MAPQLIQIKVNPDLKKDIQAIALYKGIPVTSFVKMTLTEVVRKEKKQMSAEKGKLQTREEFFAELEASEQEWEKNGGIPWEKVMKKAKLI